MENAQIAKMFEEIADLLEVREANNFRIRAYRNAAQTIRNPSDRMEELAENDEDLSKLPRIGDVVSKGKERVVKKSASSATFRVGTSGYQYDHWRGLFYPNDLPKKDWFAHYCRHYDVVEINNTFYHLPDVATFDDWREQAPAGFLYVLKFSRYGSHLKCLKDPAKTIGTFMRRAKHLKKHLGPILVQLKPNWKVNVPRLRRFLQKTSKTQRWALEFRDRSWLCDEVFDLLRDHNTALCIHDMLDDHPREVTADWVYLRFHGAHYGGSYSPQFLTAEGHRVAAHLAEGRDVFAFFNNDTEGHAVHNAADLRRYVHNAVR